MTAGSSKTLTYDYTGVGLISYLAISGESGNFSWNRERPRSRGVEESRSRNGRIVRQLAGSYAYNNGSTRDSCGNPPAGKLHATSWWHFLHCPTDGNARNAEVRTENIAGSTYTTTLTYDNVYQETAETKKDSGNNTIYALSYGYDACGNRTTRTLGGVTYTYVGACPERSRGNNNNKMASASGGGLTASFGYDNNGNMTSVSGTMYGSKSMVYNDSNYMTSITYSGTTDNY